MCLVCALTSAKDRNIKAKNYPCPQGAQVLMGKSRWGNLDHTATKCLRPDLNSGALSTIPPSLPSKTLSNGTSRDDRDVVSEGRREGRMSPSPITPVSLIPPPIYLAYCCRITFLKLLLQLNMVAPAYNLFYWGVQE